MNIYKALVLLNIDTDYRSPAQEADRLISDRNGRMVLTVKAPSFEVARSRVWAIANRMERDNEGRQWPSEVRSMSIGDVVSIRLPEEDDVRAWSVDRIGYTDYSPKWGQVMWANGATQVTRTMISLDPRR